jgi:PAS domain S-box-containing protein
MNISKLNYSPCTWLSSSHLLTKEAFLDASASTEYFVFGDTIETPFVVVDRGDIAEFFLKSDATVIDPMRDLKSRDYMTFYIQDELSSLPFVGNENKIGLVLDDNSHPLGVIIDLWNLYYISYTWKMDAYHKNLQIEFYKRIIDHIEEEVFITDEYGFIQFLNPYAEKVCGLTLAEIIGWHVEDLEKHSFISSSITKEVFNCHTTCNKIMELHTGETVLATGIPLYDKNGNLINVLATSKNIAELRDILSHLHDVTSELGIKEKQIKELQKKVITQENYVMESEAMREVKRSILKIAPTDATVLVEGESGSGKEIVAELLFKLGNRADQPFSKINCAMIPEHLLESEFFGYEPGAFTGANKSGKRGKIEMADGGTLFLDEIGEMPLSLQAKILEFLQDREIVRVGGMKRIPVDVRVIAATNRNLQAMVKEGTFRGDLYYRLNVMSIHVSPLQRRTEDIMPLTSMFLQKYNARYGKSKVFAPSVLTYFLKYTWPGNVRELMHTVERLLIISDNDVITMNDVNKVFSDNTEKYLNTELSSLKQAKHQLEISMVKQAYETYRSSYKVGDVLGISQPAVMKILKKHGFRLQNGVLTKINYTE